MSHRVSFEYEARGHDIVAECNNIYLGEGGTRVYFNGNDVTNILDRVKVLENAVVRLLEEVKTLRDEKPLKRSRDDTWIHTRNVKQRVI